jgi:hypothetical protein
MNCWVDAVTNGTLQIASPFLHDPSNPIFAFPSGIGEISFPVHTPQPLYEKDILQVSQSGSAVGGDIDSGTLAIYYTKIAGLDQNLISFNQFKTKFRNFKAIRLAHTPSVIGGYGGAVALNTTTTNLKGNTNYAVLGFDTNTLQVGTITFQGPDTQGLRIPIPFVSGQVEFYHKWFLRTAEIFPDLPMIPVLNSQNNANTFVESVHSSVFAPAGTLILLTAELS